MHKSIVWTLILAAGCKPKPAEVVPPVINDATQFLFEHFDDEDPADIAYAVSADLLPFMVDKLANLAVPDDPTDPSWYSDIPILPESALGTLTMPAGVTADVQKFPLARVRQSTHSVADNRELAVEPNRICIESETTKWATREFLTDEACFADGTCNTLSVIQPTDKRNPLTEIWYDQFTDHRVIQVDVDGDMVDVLLVRSWIEERWFSKSGRNSWDQIWALDIIIDQPGGSIGWNAYWTSLQVSLLSDGLLATSLRDGLAEAADWSEYFMTNGAADPNCPNTRDNPMPERWPNVKAGAR